MDGIYWVMDTEGNGANPNEPIELGMVQMDGYEITGKAHVWRFKPFAPVTYYANRVHNISNDDLAKCPSFEDTASEILEILGTHPVIGHSVAVEINMLQPRLNEWKPNAAYDTLKIARRLLPDQRQHKLQILADQFDLSSEARKMTGMKPHSGLYDSVVTALLLKRLQSDHQDRFDALFKSSDILPGRRSRQERDERRARNKQLRDQARGTR